MAAQDIQVHVNGCRRQTSYVNCIYRGIGHEVAAEGGRSPDAIEEFYSAIDFVCEYNTATGRDGIVRPSGRLTMEEIRRLAQEAVRVIPERVAYYAPKVGVTYGRITIRNQRSRWGSCSSKGNLNFNCLLMLAPMEVIDSVVVHELCHRLEMNHSRRFYEHVLRVYPDYYRYHDWLKKNGTALMRRMTG